MLKYTVDNKFWILNCVASTAHCVNGSEKQNSLSLLETNSGHTARGQLRSWLTFEEPVKKTGVSFP
jgi:hypothetical protein